MKTIEWYRNEDWNEEIQEDFFAHLKRSRSEYHRAQYLRIQAFHLKGTNIKQNIVVAKTLLEKCLLDYPNDSQRCQAYKTLAECKGFLGDIDGAIEDFRKAVNREFEYPGISCNSNTVFARFVTEQERQDLYDEVLGNLDKIKPRELVFPSQKYDAFFALAIIYEKKGGIELAKKFAKEAITELEKTSSGFSRHNLLGLVKKDKTFERMEKIINM
jgi:tetratricopeptide (TPR) repeat protein